MIHRHYKIKLSSLCFVCILTGVIFAIPVAFAADDPIADALHDYHRADDDDERLLDLGTYCELIISARTSAIDSTIAQIIAEGRIENNDKSEITSMLNIYKESLNDSSNSISTITNLDALKDLTRNIFWENRIFHVVIPKAHGLKTVAKSEYILENDIEKHLATITKVSEELDKLDVDVSDLEKKIVNLEGITISLTATLAEARQNFEDMDPISGVAFNATKLDTARNRLSSVKEYLLDAQNQIRQTIPIVEGLLESAE